MQKKQIFTQPKLTTPNLAKTVSEIVNAHSKGLPLNVGQKTPIYGTSGRDPKAYDLVELQEMKIKNQEKIDKLSAEAKEKIKADKEKKHKEWIDSQVEKALAAKDSETKTD